jgi:thiamine-triphosphatase
MIRFPSTIRLEVERKFAGLKCYPLRFDSGHPPFLSLTDIGRERFHDVYYDSEARLSKAGTWLRQRDGKWQMKIRKGGTYTNSQFEELSDPGTISAHVKTLTGLDSGLSKTFGLSRLAALTTFRQSWIADNEFKIVLDQTDFGHMVGEVELESETNVKNEDEARKVMLIMDNKIAQFLQRYHWAFSNDEAVGKLSAYFDHKAREGT